MSLIEMLPCPQCHSRDNMAHYTDGFHCFGCGYRKSKRVLSQFNAVRDAKVCNGLSLTKELSRDALTWLTGYSLTPLEMAQFRMSYDNGTNYLVLLHTPDYWCARNFGKGVKYMSSGTKPMVKYGNNPDMLVFCEDVISAIKLARYVTAIPMLGASVLPAWWELVRGYKRIAIYGDRDMATRNIIASRRATELTGSKVECIITERDPKDYSNKDLEKVLIIN